MNSKSGGDMGYRKKKNIGIKRSGNTFEGKLQFK